MKTASAFMNLNPLDIQRKRKQGLIIMMTISFEDIFDDVTIEEALKDLESKRDSNPKGCSG